MISVTMRFLGNIDLCVFSKLDEQLFTKETSFECSPGIKSSTQPEPISVEVDSFVRFFIFFAHPDNTRIAARSANTDKCDFIFIVKGWF